MYPKGRCSEIQEKQLNTVSEDNIHVFEGEGTSDDFDVVVKNCFSDREFSESYNLLSFSSINWTRILVQMVHYFYSYLKTVSKIGEEVNIVVPSGGLGNLTGEFETYINCNFRQWSVPRGGEPEKIWIEGLGFLFWV